MKSQLPVTALRRWLENAANSLLDAPESCFSSVMSWPHGLVCLLHNFQPLRREHQHEMDKWELHTQRLLYFGRFEGIP